ncbi:hypothetical protein F5879DRAFT_1063908 [Lentinula edodes]|nr:hypothetical protein F5879DRAFT_1063908 [Lentinula edodes]
MPRQSSAQSDATENFTFNGDFFGTYSAEDFPGFEDDIIDGEGDDAEDSAQADDPAALEHTWEPARELQTVGADMEVNDFEDLAQSTSRFHSSAGSSLQQLPAHRDGIHVQTFGALAGAPLMNTKLPTHKLSSAYEHYQSKIPDGEANIWAPFISQMDWEVAQWAKMRSSGSTAFLDLLAIEGVMEALGLSYADSMELNGIIDNDLPSRRPLFTQSEVVIGGQAFDLYRRPILDCIKALYGNPEHSQYLCFAPERHYADPDRTMHLYHDFNTGRWWWDTQRAIKENKPGATIIPVIISSDKTQVTLFRNKSAYPVYLTIGNLPKEIRCKPSQQGQILLAYLPSTRLKHILNKTARRCMVVNLFHSCMTSLVAPLKEAGLEGITMQSGDGVSRRCHPILASYVGDYPEQCLVTTCYSGNCPSCETEKEDLGLFPADECLAVNLKPVQHPFWENLPYTDIFRSITPNILHQMYQGVIKHLISWLTDICGADEMDAHVRCLPPNHNICIFHKGISSLSRVSGTEHKQMCSFILGTIVDIPQLTAVQSNALLAATQALLDFLYPIHSSNTLVSLDESLARFHAKREIFVKLNVRENFNFPKLHFFSHYSRAIKYFGTTDNYTTETTERLHIDFAKEAYRASNHKDEYTQMTRWLERREKIIQHSNYISWRLNGSRRTLTDMKCVFQQKITSHPTMKSISLIKLEDASIKGYGAIDFTLALKRFVVQFRDPSLPTSVVEYAHFIVLPFQSLPVWHQIKFTNVGLFGKNTLDSVLARPFSQLARFDTALICVKPNSENHTIKGRHHTIFSLPEDKLDAMFPPNCHPPKHLAYVEWFTKFTRVPEPHSGLYRVKKQMNVDGTPAASVIPVEMILRSVHLLPKWGGAVPSGWTGENVLDLAPSFLLNIFKDNHSYFNLV